MSKISIAKEERGVVHLRHQYTNRQELDVNGKWEVIPCDWIINYPKGWF